MYLLGCISASIGGIFLKIHMGHSTHKFGCDQTIVEGVLLGKVETFRLYFGFHWRDIPKISHLVFNAHSLQSA